MTDKVLKYRLNLVKTWLETYQGQEPLSSFLKKKFNLEKKFGSRDRRKLSDLVYNYFRLGNLGKKFDIESQLLLGSYLFQEEDPDFNMLLGEKLGIVKFGGHFGEKLNHVCEILDLNKYDLFPLNAEMCKKIKLDDFIDRYGHKPKVWVRLRKNAAAVKASIESSGFVLKETKHLANAYSVENPKGLELSPAFLKGNFEIQDVSSQICADHVQVPNGASVWDACAGSGGKTLYLLDKYNDIMLSCSDIRKTILENLQRRIDKAGHKNVSTNTIDLQDPNALKIWKHKWKYIVADVPCSGSGTWGRTPEQMAYFTLEKLDEFVEKQKAILQSLISTLDEKGIIYYITCSVFEKENEGLTAEISKLTGIKVVDEFWIKGYRFGADSMYFCVLQKE